MPSHAQGHDWDIKDGFASHSPSHAHIAHEGFESAHSFLFALSLLLLVLPLPPLLLLLLLPPPLLVSLILYSSSSFSCLFFLLRLPSHLASSMTTSLLILLLSSCTEAMLSPDRSVKSGTSGKNPTRSANHVHMTIKRKMTTGANAAPPQ